MDEPLALGAVAPPRPHARWALRGLGGALVLTGVVLAAVALSRTGAWGPVLARLAVAAGDPNAAELVRSAEVALSRAASKGVIHKNNASRRTSRLMQSLNKAAA